MKCDALSWTPICPPQIESWDQTSTGVLISLSQRTLGCQPQKLSKVKLEHARSMKKKRGPSKMDFISPNLCWILINPDENVSKQYNQMKISKRSVGQMTGFWGPYPQICQSRTIWHISILEDKIEVGKEHFEYVYLPSSCWQQGISWTWTKMIFTFSIFVNTNKKYACKKEHSSLREFLQRL